MGPKQTGVLCVLMSHLFWMDPHGLVDLFENEQSRVFRLPTKQRKC